MNKRRKFLKSTSLIVASAGLAGYQVTYAANQFSSTAKPNKKTMIQHNVYFWLKDTVTATEKKDFEKGVHDFVTAVKSVHKFEIGIPAPTPQRDVVDHSFGYSLFTWFKSMNDHNIYQDHPAHKKFIDNFSGLWERVQVFDSEIL